MIGGTEKLPASHQTQIILSFELKLLGQDGQLGSQVPPLPGAGRWLSRLAPHRQGQAGS